MGLRRWYTETLNHVIHEDLHSYLCPYFRRPLSDNHFVTREDWRGLRTSPHGREGRGSCSRAIPLTYFHPLIGLCPTYRRESPVLLPPQKGPFDWSGSLFSFGIPVSPKGGPQRWNGICSGVDCSGWIHMFRG